MLMEINAPAGISLRSSFEIISTTTGGVENVGCTKVDHRNHLARIRQRQMIRDEATTITEYFRDKSRLCPGFRYEVEVDAEENIANIFWANQKCGTIMLTSAIQSPLIPPTRRTNTTVR
ncbi:hypothetical protein LINGRAHAP2_LOCUS4723 [Linum grandiflorum]